MSFDFNNDLPIYKQIIDYIKNQIICEKFKSGEKLPSVRELSVELNVNPNTVQKALSELEETHIIFTERTNGNFVTKDEKLIEEIKNQTIQAKINEFFDSIQNIGLSKQQIIDYILKCNKEK